MSLLSLMLPDPPALPGGGHREDWPRVQSSAPGLPPAPGPGPGPALGGSGPQRSASFQEEEENQRSKMFHKSMSTVELFVFLFAPLIHRIKVGKPVTPVNHHSPTRPRQGG